MNEIKAKDGSKELWKDIGLALLAGAMIYWIGPSWDMFVNAPFIEKGFYGLFTLVILYSLMSVIKKLFLKDRNIPFLKKKANPAEMVNITNRSLQGQLEQLAVPPSEPDVSSILQQINRDIEESSLTNPENTGRQMIGQIKNRVDNFNINLDEEANNLENQYREMEKLKLGIHQNVSEMFTEYKRLERQMQIVDTMIKTKRLLGERIRQLKEKP